MQPGPMRHTILHGDDIPPLPTKARDIVMETMRLADNTAVTQWENQKEELILALQQLFPQRRHQQLDTEQFWEQSCRCAQIAERLAVHLDLNPSQAWMAAFMSDIGKLVLDWLLPGGYAVAHAPDDGIRLLEAERNKLGADHTLVGKWTAERWRLPHVLASVLWLHHHPPQVLDGQLYPIHLIDLAALAQALGRFPGRASQPFPDTVHERKRRLGLSHDALREALSNEIKDEPAHVPPATMPAAYADADKTPEVYYLKAYRQFREDLDGIDDINALMLAVCEAFRGVFSVPAGICYARIDGRLFGQIWRSIDTPMQPLSVNEQLLQGAMGTPLGILLEAFEAMPEPENEADVTSPREHHGLMGVPVSHGPRVFGYFIVDRAIWEEGWDGAALDGILAFARAAGASLASELKNEAVRAESEQLAEALWRQELRLETQQKERKQAEVARFAAGVSRAMLDELESVEAALSRGKLSQDALLGRIRNVQAVVEDALEVTDPSLGERGLLSLEAVLRRVVRAMSKDLEDGGVAVYEEYAATLPDIEGNEQKLAIAFRRLLQDGVEAMGSEGGLLTIRAWRASEGESVMLQVSDTGPAVREEDIDRLFVPFAQSSARNGGGLRLALCKAIVDAHGGAMSVQNDPAHGVRFQFCFPAAATTQEDSRPVILQEPASTGPLTPEDPWWAETLDPADLPAPPRLPKIEVWRPVPLEAPEDADHEEAPDIATTIPVAEAPVADEETARKPRRLPSAGGKGPGHMLLIEENDDLREVLRVSLEARGFRVHGLSAWSNAEADADDSDYDGIILDLDHRPDTTGATVRQLLKAYPGVALIAIAGVGHRDRMDTALEEGALACLEKPIEIEALLKHLNQIVKDRRVA